MQASAPPAIITSALSQAIRRAASPIACAPLAQAVLGDSEGPCTPRSMLTWAVAMLTSRSGTKYGDMRRGPRSTNAFQFVASASRLAIPTPMLTPVRGPPGASPESAYAALAACTANATNRGHRPPLAISSSSGIRPAIRHGRRGSRLSSTASVEQSPDSRRDQTAGTESPSGAITPSPVTTTWRRIFCVVHCTDIMLHIMWCTTSCLLRRYRQDGGRCRLAFLGRSHPRCVPDKFAPFGQYFVTAAESTLHTAVPVSRDPRDGSPRDCARVLSRAHP